MSLSKIVFAFAFATASVGAVACSASPEDLATDESSDQGTEEIHSSVCGGLAAIKCPIGYECQLPNHIPDYPGTCVRARGEGAYCGGFGGISCPKGYTCKLAGNYPDASGMCHKTGTVCTPR